MTALRSVSEDGVGAAQDGPPGRPEPCASSNRRRIDQSEHRQGGARGEEDVVTGCRSSEGRANHRSWRSQARQVRQSQEGAGPSSSARVRASKRVLSRSLAIWSSRRSVMRVAEEASGIGVIAWPMTITDVLAHSDARYSADDSI